MRVNLFAKTSAGLLDRSGCIPLSLTIKPTCGVEGTFEYATNSTAVLRMLRNQTDLNGTVIDRFRSELEILDDVRLLGVALKDEALEQVGFFID